MYFYAFSLFAERKIYFSTDYYFVSTLFLKKIKKICKKFFPANFSFILLEFLRFFICEKTDDKNKLLFLQNRNCGKYGKVISFPHE